MSDCHVQGSRPTPLDQLNATLSPALPSLAPNSSPSTPFPPSPSNEHSDSLLPPRIPPSLSTLPLDIIHEIVDRGGPEFIFPLTNHRLLPFHISTLYRTVRLSTSNLGHFQRTLRLHPDKYESLIRILHFHVSESQSSRPRPVTPGDPVGFYRLDVERFDGLEELHLTGDYEILTDILAQSRWYESFRHLRIFHLHSDHAPTSTVFELIDHVTLDGVPVEIVSSMHSSGLLLVAEKSPDSTFDIAYCGGPASWTYFLTLLSAIAITRLRICFFFAGQTTTEQVFTNLDPSLLVELQLFLLNPDSTAPAEDLQVDDSFSCPVLKRLAIGGNLTVPWRRGLEHAPLETIHFGPKTLVLPDRLIGLLRSSPKNENSLESVKLDNIFSALPVPADPVPDDWCLPEWKVSFTRAQAENLRDVTRKLGIEISGTTFLGLEILESEEYREALEREEEEED